MKPEITVIVPMYNAENTLAACLGNLCNQTIKDRIEILLVDDASTDGTLKICRDAQGAFGEAVRVISQEENRGPGAARNRGIIEARGQYIGFVDADDVVDVTMYEQLLTAMEDQLSGVSYDFADAPFVRESNGQALQHVSPELRGVLSVKKRATLIASGGYVWSKLFRRDFLINNEGELLLPFREVYSLEDMDFLVRAIMKAVAVNGVDSVLYLYKDTAGSLSKVTDTDGYIAKQMEAMEAVAAAVKDADVQILEAADYAMAALYLNAISCCVLRKKHSRDPEMTRRLKEIREHRMKCIKGDLSKNKEVQAKMSRQDLKLMTACDADPKKPLAL